MTGPASAASILFIGNSFTYAAGSPVHYYRGDTVTDLNGLGIGGVPALFKSFTSQASLQYDVYLETEPGVGIDWHLEHKLNVLGARPWDVVVMHGYSTLDRHRPGDPALLVASVRRMSDFLRLRNPNADLRLMATWPRADQIYEIRGPWYGTSVDVMARDLRRAYEEAAAASKARSVVPVGDAWVRAMHSGVADANPYDGIDAGKLDLWTYDHYHASTYGYYLEALTLFGSITGRDPRSLGDHECSGYELGLSTVQVAALEQIAFDELAAHGPLAAAAAAATGGGEPARCSAQH